MTTLIEKARSNAAYFRGGADATDHVDEESALRDLAQLLEQLADAIPTSGGPRRDGLRKALSDAGVAVAEGEWKENLLDRLERIAAQPEPPEVDAYDAPEGPEEDA